MNPINSNIGNDLQKRTKSVDIIKLPLKIINTYTEENFLIIELESKQDIKLNINNLKGNDYNCPITLEKRSLANLLT